MVILYTYYIDVMFEKLINGPRIRPIIAWQDIGLSGNI